MMSTIRRRMTGSFKQQQQLTLPTFNMKQPIADVRAYSSSPAGGGGGGGGGGNTYNLDGTETSSPFGHIRPSSSTQQQHSAPSIMHRRTKAESELASSPMSERSAEPSALRLQQHIPGDEGWKVLLTQLPLSSYVHVGGGAVATVPA